MPPLRPAQDHPLFGNSEHGALLIIAPRSPRPPRCNLSLLNRLHCSADNRYILGVMRLPVHLLVRRALLAILGLLCSSRAVTAGPAQDAATYAESVARINNAHLRQPGKTTEAQLAGQMPANAKSALKRAIDSKPAPDLAPALLKCGEAALDLDLLQDFEAVRTKLAAVAPAEAEKLGTAVSRPRFIVRGIGAFAPGYLNQFADALDAVLGAYDDVFGFAEFSKVPGKKLRIRVHLEPVITRAPHFAPQFPWHSEIDFPVIDGQQFSSPTSKGHFLFYGLCHELGHVIAMWGDLKTMEDHHAWAHYTGVVIVEHLAQQAKDLPALQNLRDARWKSLTLERALPDSQFSPSLKDTQGVMTLLIALHDSVGPKAIGAALNRLDAQNKEKRVNQVRYYSFADFEKALIEAAPAQRAAISKAFGK